MALCNAVVVVLALAVLDSVSAAAGRREINFASSRSKELKLTADIDSNTIQDVKNSIKGLYPEGVIWEVLLIVTDDKGNIDHYLENDEGWPAALEDGDTVEYNYVTVHELQTSFEFSFIPRDAHIKKGVIYVKDWTAAKMRNEIIDLKKELSKRSFLDKMKSVFVKKK